MTVTVDAAIATDSRYDLAEGVVWDERKGRLFWVDITAGRVHTGRLEGRRIDPALVAELPETVGAVALAEDGGLLLAGARGLIVVAPDGTVSSGPDLLGSGSDIRLNDGSVDPQGRFLVGTLSLPGAGGQQVLLRVSPDGEVETLRHDVGLSNGIAFAPDGRTVFHVDTDAGTISSHGYGAGRFDDEPWTVVVDGPPGMPDGLTIDSSGCLWVALWGGSTVERRAPTGELLARIAVDAAQVTCPAFVGQRLDLLAIATARAGRGSPTDGSGAIFLADVEAKGLPAYRWRGSTIDPSWAVERRSDATGAVSA